MKALVFIEHDVIIRHFVHSGAFAAMVREHDVTFVFPEQGFNRVSIDVSKLDLHGARYRHLTVNQQRLSIWKRLFRVEILRRRRDPDYRVLAILHREMMGWKASALYTFFGLPGIFQWLRWRSHRTLAATPFADLETLLDETKPDILIHPSVLEGAYINDLVDISQRRKLPLVVIMNSWDNPSSKRSVVGSPDWMLVWGPQTKAHAVDFMKMSPERVVCFGAAQFEIYRQSARLTRDEFCKRHDIDPKNAIMLYAGSSKGTDEFAHLSAIDEAIERGELGDVKLVYRPHPWGNGGFGGERIIGHPWRHVRIESTMRAYLEGVRSGDRRMTFPDYKDTRDVLASVDMLVSPLSTIILEGAMLGKPALCFLPVDEKQARHFQLAMPLKHFDDMFNMDEFLVARSESALIPALKILVKRAADPAFKSQLRAACGHFVTSFDQPYGERLAEFCATVASRGDIDTLGSWR